VKWYDVEPLIGPLFRLSMFLRQKVRARRIRRGKAKQQKLQLEDPRMNMDTLTGALKSKLVWLGIVQVGYSLFETWASGGLNAEAVSTAISGVLTIVFRAVTNTSLADKA
jgi:hypothetical protein